MEEKLKLAAQTISMEFASGAPARLKAVDVKTGKFKLGTLTFSLLDEITLPFLENFTYLKLTDPINDQFDELVSINFTGIYNHKISDKDFIGINVKNCRGIIFQIGYVYIKGKVQPHISFRPEFLNLSIPNVLIEINK